MIHEQQVPDWVKVKVAAVAGLSTTWLMELLTRLGPVLDVVIKLGQAGVATVTILYIYAKFKKVKNSKSE